MEEPRRESDERSEDGDTPIVENGEKHLYLKDSNDDVMLVRRAAPEAFESIALVCCEI